MTRSGDPARPLRHLSRAASVCACLLLMALGAGRDLGRPARAQVDGSVAGRVAYLGTVPQPLYVFESGASQAILSLDEHAGLASAVVYLHAPAAGPAEGSPEVVVNQRNWWFTPGTVAVRSGQPVRFTNDDPANHNVRSSRGVAANRFSVHTGSGEPYVHRFRTNPDSAPVVLTCDIHHWMMAWVYVFDHPYFTMTDRSGAFSIPGVEPGRHRLSVRQGPAGLAKDMEVAVTDGRESRVEVSFETADLNVPGR